MRFNYLDLIENSEHFEEFIVAVCSVILGEGVTGFALGKDGGRDARFHHKTNNYPSKQECWEPKGRQAIIIQAKFTYGYNKTTGEREFNNLIEKELSKLKKLREEGELGYYILATNRKLTANSLPKLLNRLSDMTGLPHQHIQIWGKEKLVRFLQSNEQILKKSGLIELARRRFNLVDDSLIAKVIKTCAKKLDHSEKSLNVVDRTTLDEKNKLNNASDEFTQFIISQYADEFFRIDKLLANPDNSDLKRDYTNLTKHISLQLHHYRNKFEYLDEKLYQIIQDEEDHDKTLKAGNSKIILQILIHYMYWHCDIGKNVE
ncbi:ABC-three component system protein [Histophilus somni]|uniref:ABC-three component system protein n=1 Tax=Histophilus somni TaxID=731 RepID=UPI00201EB9F8|nr:ABC-three component system protein [Histophilus somni]